MVCHKTSGEVLKVQTSYWDSFNHCFRYITTDGKFNIPESDLEESKNHKEAREFMRNIKGNYEQEKKEKKGHCKTIERAWF